MGETGEPDVEDGVTSGFFGEELFVDPPFEVFVLERSFDDFPPIVFATNAMRQRNYKLQTFLLPRHQKGRFGSPPRSRRFLSEYWGGLYL